MYCLQASWTFFLEDDEKGFFASPITSKQYRISGFSKSLLEHLSRGIEYQQLSLPDKTILDFLIEKEIVVPSNREKKAVTKRFEKQALFFDLFERKKQTGAHFQEVLSKRSVCIIGLGGYGTWLSLLFSEIGIGQIIGIDFDIVEESNLNRQILYKRKDVGKLKTEAAAQYFKEFFPSTHFIPVAHKVEKMDSLQEIVSSTDLVLNMVSYDSRKSIGFEVASWCLEQAIPCLHYGGNWIGPLTIPNQTICYECALKHLQATGKGSGSKIGSFAPHIAQLTCPHISPIHK